MSVTEIPMKRDAAEALILAAESAIEAIAQAREHKAVADVLRIAVAEGRKSMAMSKAEKTELQAQRELLDRAWKVIESVGMQSSGWDGQRIEWRRGAKAWYLDWQDLLAKSTKVKA